MNLLQKSRHRKFGLAILAVLALAGIVILTADQIVFRDPHILPNVEVAYVPVGGLTAEEAEKKLMTAISGTNLPPIVLTDRKDVWQIDSRDIDLSVDIKKSVGQAFALRRGESLFERWRDRMDLQGQTRYLHESHH